MKLYDSFGEVITTADLEEYDTAEGDVRYVLEYYRVADGFAGAPVSRDREVAIKNMITDSSPAEKVMKPRALEKRRPEASV